MFKFGGKKEKRVKVAFGKKGFLVCIEFSNKEDQKIVYFRTFFIVIWGLNSIIFVWMFNLIITLFKKLKFENVNDLVYFQ
jgi:hypothetical protein